MLTLTRLLGATAQNADRLCVEEEGRGPRSIGREGRERVGVPGAGLEEEMAEGRTTRHIDGRSKSSMEGQQGGRM
jgi:hypothetical protein